MIWVVYSLLIVSVALNVLLTVLVLTSSQRGMLLLDASHQRTVTYTEGLLTRLEGLDWGAIHAHEILPQAEEETPAIQLVPTLGPDRGGFGSRHGLRGWAAEDEINPEEEMP